MKTERKVHKPMPDLTRIKDGKSVGIQLEDLIKNADKLSLEELKISLIKILDNPDTIVSKEKAYTYKTAMYRVKNEEMMRRFITNIYLAAANMGIKQP